MVQMLTRVLKPLGRPKQPRKTSELSNTTIRDFGGGLNVVDSEQNLTSRFAPVFDNMVTYTDKRVGPRYGYEMWLKLKQGVQHSGTANIQLTSTSESRIVIVSWAAHPFTGSGFEHITISGWDLTFNGITPEMINRVHGIRRVIDANGFEIVVSNPATAGGASGVDAISWTRDDHLLGGEPIECRYFSNHVVLWTSVGEILAINRDKGVTRIYSQAVTFARALNPIAWTYTELIAQDIFGQLLVCSNGRDKPLQIDFTKPIAETVMPVLDGTPPSDTTVFPFDACKSSFGYFTTHDTDLSHQPEFTTQIRVAAKNTHAAFTTSPVPLDAVDIRIGMISGSPEQVIRGFAVIKDALLVISPNTTTLMKLNNRQLITTVVGGESTTTDKHDPIPIDTLNGFGSNAPRSIVEIGSDVFMLDFNGVPSAKLSTVSNAVVPERVSNFIETMISKHIGRMRKEIMRLKVFGFYDAKNKSIHFYMPKFDPQDVRKLVGDPFFFDNDMAANEATKNMLIMRNDNHQLERDDIVLVAGTTDFAGIDADDYINGARTVVNVIDNDHVMIRIGTNLPTNAANGSGGGLNVMIGPVNDGSIGYIYHYVPQTKLVSWSRFKTDGYLMFNCGCCTIEGRSFLFTPDGYMMRYGSPDNPVYADWVGWYDHPTWTSGYTYQPGNNVVDTIEGKVYECLETVTTTAPDFYTARALAPNSWEEYRGEKIKFAWELPWADFGARQATKALRFCHVDANGTAQFSLSLYADNIQYNASTGERIPARDLTFVPNEAHAYGGGPQVYGAGRRTREQRLWSVPVKFKLLKARISGSSDEPLSISAMSFMYQRGSMNRG